MYVCLCNRVTDQEIVRELDDGARNLRDLNKRLGVGSQCGSCCKYAKEIISEHKSSYEYGDLAYAAS